MPEITEEQINEKYDKKDREYFRIGFPLLLASIFFFTHFNYQRMELVNQEQPTLQKRQVIEHKLTVRECDNLMGGAALTYILSVFGTIGSYEYHNRRRKKELKKIIN
ncbi:hypothetical protein K8R47_01250 [archaeon]|nr:hypothetical protein [archaeon]